jgi:hypothetical protein
MKKPDFFIVGAPRSGTISMQKYLSEHPDIFMPAGEPSFFCPDYVKPRLSKEEYLDLFKKGKNKKVMGEKTVFYLPSNVAAKKIAQFNPEAKIIIMIRNPIEAVYSFHSKMITLGRETISDFKKAWKRQGNRKIKKDNFYKGKLKEKTLFYGEVYKLGKHLKRFHDYFPEENIKSILFDDFVRGEKEIYREVLGFLNLGFDGRKDFSKVNSNKKTKSKLLNYILRMRGVIPVKKIKKILGIKRRIGLISRLMRVNQKESKRKPLDENFKLDLSNFFQDDIKLLSNLIDKDLSNWLK